MVDLRRKYYLFTFAGSEDRMHAKMKGHWLIYNHYLSVKEWSANFHSNSKVLQTFSQIEKPLRNSMYGLEYLGLLLGIMMIVCWPSLVIE